MTQQAYPKIRELLSTKGSNQYKLEKWKNYCLRFEELIYERMNVRRGSVRKYLIKTSSSEKFNKQLLLTLALSSGQGGLKRLSSSVFDPFF